jgi:hypothetical protein
VAAKNLSGQRRHPLQAVPPPPQPPRQPLVGSPPRRPPHSPTPPRSAPSPSTITASRAAPRRHRRAVCAPKAAESQSLDNLPRNALEEVPPPELARCHGRACADS